MSDTVSARRGGRVASGGGEPEIRDLNATSSRDDAKEPNWW